MSNYSIKDLVSKDLAEQLNLNPLKEGEVVEFRLDRANKPDPYSTKKISSPQGHILPGKDMIKDPYDKKNGGLKLILNVTGYDPIMEPGKKTIYNPIADYVRFGSTGSIFITDTQMNELYFMRATNKNSGNPNRIATKTKVFHEVDETKEVTLKNNVFDYRYLASSILIEAGEGREVIDLGFKVQQHSPTLININDISMPTPQNIAKVKARLAIIAEQNPVDFIVAVKEAKSYTRLLIDDAVARRQIFFDDHAEKQAWTWKLSSVSKKVITKVEPGTSNPTKSLVEFLLSKDGSEHLHELKMLNEKNYVK